MSESTKGKRRKKIREKGKGRSCEGPPSTLELDVHQVEFLIVRFPTLQNSLIYTGFRRSSPLILFALSTSGPLHGLSSLTIFADISQHILPWVLTIPFRCPLVILPATTHKNGQQITEVFSRFDIRLPPSTTDLFGAISKRTLGIVQSYASPALEGPVPGPIHR